MDTYRSAVMADAAKLAADIVMLAIEQATADMRDPLDKRVMAGGILLATMERCEIMSPGFKANFILSIAIGNQDLIKATIRNLTDDA